MRTLKIVAAAALALAVVAGSAIAEDQIGHILWQHYYGSGEKWFKATGIVLSAIDCIKAKQYKDEHFGAVVQSACVRVGEDPEVVMMGGHRARPVEPASQCPGTSVWTGRGCTSRVR